MRNIGVGKNNLPQRKLFQHPGQGWAGSEVIQGIDIMHKVEEISRIDVVLLHQAPEGGAILLVVLEALHRRIIQRNPHLLDHILEDPVSNSIHQPGPAGVKGFI